MIFVTVGTGKFPFNRLLEAIDHGMLNGEIKEEVFAQSGSSTYKPQMFAFKDFCNFDEEVELIKRADIVVSHAGEGLFLLCLSLGKIPILFPRQASLKEAVDDHQIELAKKMEETGRALSAYNEKELLKKTANYRNLVCEFKETSFSNGKEKIINYLREICS